MALFGRKASRQSGIADVPPELQPYYREQAVAAQNRHALLRLVSVFLIIALIIGGTAWLCLHRRDISDRINSTVASMTGDTKKGTNQNQPTDNTPAQNGSNTPSPAPSPSPQPSPSPAPAPTPSPSSGGNVQPQPSPQPTPTPVTPNPTPTPTPASSQSNSGAIPNTGPRETVLLAVAGAVALVAVVGYQLRLRRRA